MSARPSPFHISENPLVQGLSLLVGAALLIGAVVIGAFLLAIALGVGLVLALILVVRVWWIQRKLERAADGAAVSRGRKTEGRVIEVEYRVIDEEPDERRD